MSVETFATMSVNTDQIAQLNEVATEAATLLSRLANPDRLLILCLLVEGEKMSLRSVKKAASSSPPYHNNLLCCVKMGWYKRAVVANMCITASKIRMC